MSLSIASYNMQGSGPGHLEYVNKLVKANDIVFIQEHWYTNDMLPLMNNAIENSVIYGVSGMKDNDIRVGRNYGGTAIICNRSLNCNIEPIHTDSDRLCAAKLTIGKMSMLIASIYMPIDTCYDKANLESFKYQLNVITQLCNEYDISNIIIGGDLNTDLSRTQSLHTDALLSYCQSQCLMSLQNHVKSNVDYSYESKSNGSRSMLDHVLMSDGLLGHVTEYYTLHEGDNLSDHSPITVKLNLPMLNVDRAPISEECALGPNVQWSKASDCQLENYRCMLDTLLSQIDIPTDAILCRDYECAIHNSDIVEFHNCIVNACLVASECSLPVSSGGQGCKAGWKEFVEPLRQEAIRWHITWKENNSPRSGYYADMRRQSRAKYHYAIRYISRERSSISASKMAESLLKNNDKDFWHEVKKVRGVKTQLPSTVDGITGESEICDVFAQKYESLLNCVSYDQGEMSSIVSDIDKNILSSCSNHSCYNDHVITVKQVSEAVNELKPNKRDGNEGCQSDHLINGTHRLHVLLSQLYTTMLYHAYAPDSFLLATVTSIPKNKHKSLNDSCNYRGISLSSVLGKVLDWVILRQNQNVLVTSELQFGFKAKHSTTQSTFLIDEVAQYYTNNGSNVYIMLLDASQAFDRVSYCRLFRLLLKRGLCPVICRFLAYSYTKQCTRAKWGKSVSDPFPVTNGVKQGGVLSPILFTVYMDELIAHLKATGVGCHVGHVYMGSSGYADDLSLLVPTKMGLNILLNACNSFSSMYNIKFNPAKCQLTVLGPNGPIHDTIVFNDVTVISEPIATHLGSVVGYDTCSKRVERSVNDFIVKTNTLTSLFSCTDPDVKYKLFKSYSMSMYGSALWDLTHSAVSRLHVTWRKCIRKLLDLPGRTHSILLPLICHDLPFIIQLCKRSLKFIHNALHSDNLCLSMCARLALNGSRSSMCNSINYIASIMHISKYDMVTKNIPILFRQLCDTYQPNDDNVLKAAQVTDLIYLSKHGYANFTIEDFQLLMEHIACD